MIKSHKALLGTHTAPSDTILEDLVRNLSLENEYVLSHTNPYSFCSYKMLICSVTFKFGYSWFSLTWWDSHVGVKNNGIMSLKFFIIIESNSQKAFSAIVLYTNMAAVTSHENQESLNFLEASCDKLNCTLYFCLIIVLVCLLFSPSFLDCFYCVIRSKFEIILRPSLLRLY